MLQNVWNLSGSSAATQTVFVTILSAIIVGWTLVSLWTRAIENLYFGVLGFDEESSWDSFLVALVVTVIFVAFVWMIDTYDIVPGGVESSIESEQGFRGVDFSSDDIVNQDQERQMRQTNIGSMHLSHFSDNQNGNPLFLFSGH